MFGCDNIRVKISGYLKNLTENNNIEFSCRGIKKNDRIIFSYDNVKYNIKISDNNILLVREGNDFINSFLFNKEKSETNYLLKENNYEIEMGVNTSLININENMIIIRYEILETKCLYEYKIEIGEIL